MHPNLAAHIEKEIRKNAYNPYQCEGASAIKEKENQKKGKRVQTAKTGPTLDACRHKQEGRRTTQAARRKDWKQEKL